MSLLCLDAEDEEAAAVAEEIRRRIAARMFPESRQVTASLGVTRAEENEHVDRVIGRVDRALYQAKAEGKNTVRCL